MATVQECLSSALSYLGNDVLLDKYGKDDDIDEQAFREDLEELIDDIDSAFQRSS